MAQLQQLALEKFTEGMVDEDQLSRVQFPESSCVEAENVMFMPTGALRKRDGYTCLNPSTQWAGGNQIIKIHSFTTTGSPGVDYALTFSISAAGGSACIAAVQTDGIGSEVATFNDITASGSPSTGWAPEEGTVISSTTYGGSAIFTWWENDASPSIWAGLTITADIQDCSAMPSGGRVMQSYGNYLFIGNVLTDSGTIRRGSRIQWNDSAVLSSWPDAQFHDLDADDGDEITAIAPWRNKLVIFKKYKMFVLHYVGGVEQFAAERVSTTIGCVGPNAWLDDGGDLYFIGAYGFYKWNGQGEPISISDKIQTQVDNMNMGVSKTFDVDSDDSSFQIWFFVATGTSTIKNMLFVFDTRFQSWSRFVFSNDFYCVGGINFGATETYGHKTLPYEEYGDEQIQDAVASAEGILIFGGDGYIYRYGEGTSDDGVAFEGYWLSRWLDFGMPHSNKRLIRATAFIERLGDYNLHVDLYTDWNTAIPSTQKTVSLEGDVSYPMVERRIDFTKYFRSVQLKLYTDEIGTPFTLHRLLIDWVGKGKTQVA